MADTTLNSGNRVQQWRKKYFREFIRDNRFARYQGTSENSIIQMIEDLEKSAGDKINVPLVTRLTGDGVTNDDTLEGNEEQLGNYNHQLTVNQKRNAVVVAKMVKIRTKIDLLDAAKSMLQLWDKEKYRDAVIQAMESPNADGLTSYADSTETQKDAWLAAQNPTSTNERVLFGAARSNETTGDHSTSLGNIDGTADDLSPAILSLGKRFATTCAPHIRPVRIPEEDEEWFVAFAEPLAFRDLNTNIATTHQNAAPRSLEDNPLFKGGDVVTGGVICREVPEKSVITGVGAGSIDVSSVQLCGAQALGSAWAQRSEPEMDDFDYKNKRGVSIGAIYGVEKLMYNSFQHGMVTIYVSAVGD